MKTRFIALLFFGTLATYAQTSTEKITKELTFEKKGPNNALMIFNINGNVKVEGYSGDKIIVEVEKLIYGKTDVRLEKGKTEIQLGVMDRADTFMLYVQGICSEFGKSQRGKKGNNWGTKRNGWGYH